MAKRVVNPVFSGIEREMQNEQINSEGFEEKVSNVETASYLGIGIKTGILIVAAIISGMIACTLAYNGEGNILYGLIAVSFVTSFVSVIVGTRNLSAAKVCSIIYALGEGLTLGLLVAIVDAYIPSIIPTAIAALVVIFATMLVLYTTGVVKNSSKLRAVIMSVLISYLVLSLVGLIMYALGSSIIIQAMNYGYTGIIISAILVFVGALCLVTDFDNAATIVNSQADKKYEWQVSFGLMISIVYLFVQIIRLLLIISSNRD